MNRELSRTILVWTVLILGIASEILWLVAFLSIPAIVTLGLWTACFILVLIEYRQKKIV